MSSKLKSFVRSEQTYIAGLLIFVGLVSYQLGQYSAVTNDDGPDVQTNQAGIIFTDAPAMTVPLDAVQVVASSGGTKYHRLDCPGANTIKEENKIYFDSIELAQAAGYTPAANCDFY